MIQVNRVRREKRNRDSDRRRCGEDSPRHRRKELLIHNAIEERCFVPFFQSIVDSVTGETLALEALSRIHLDDGTLLGAHEYIEIAEKICIIHKLGYTVMDCLRTAGGQWLRPAHLREPVPPRTPVLSQFIRELKDLTAVQGTEPSWVVVRDH